MDESDDWTPPKFKLEIIEVDADDESILKEISAFDSDLDFYDPIKDLKYEKWQSAQHPIHSSALSCPKCFTTICYNSTVSFPSYTTSKTINTSIGSTCHESATSLYLSVDCEICSCNLGVFDPVTKEFNLFHVLGETSNLE